METTKKVLVIIPAHNEEANIRGVVESIRMHVPAFDILVINDGSTDNTVNALEELTVPYINHPYNLFYGGALQTGFKYAVKMGYDYVLQFDGDGQHAAEELPKLYAAAETSDADIIMGSRFLEVGKYEQSSLRLLGTKFFSMLIKLFTGKAISDPTSGLQLLKRNVFSFYSKGANFPQEYPDANILIMMLLAGYKIREESVQMHPRIAGESMHHGLSFVKYTIKMLYSIVIALFKGTDYKRGRGVANGC